MPADKSLKPKIKREKSETRTVYFIDIDDTLFRTECKVYIKKDGKRIKELTPSLYNSYEKAEGEEIDFSDFSNTKLFIDTAIPILPTLDKLVKIINKILIKNTKDKVVLLTSRPDFDNKNKILDYLEKFGIPVHNRRIIQIVRCGNINDSIWNTAEKKQLIVGSYLFQNKFKNFIMWDDNIDNLKMFYQVKMSSFKPVNFIVGHVVHDLNEDGKTFNFKLIEKRNAHALEYMNSLKKTATNQLPKLDPKAQENPQPEDKNLTKKEA